MKSDLFTVNGGCDILDPFSLNGRQKPFVRAESASMKLAKEAQIKAELVCVPSWNDDRKIENSFDIA